MAPGEQCKNHAETVSEIHEKLDRILEKLGEGRVNFATLALRIKIVESVVYGGVAVILLTQWKAIFGAG